MSDSNDPERPAARRLVDGVVGAALEAQEVVSTGLSAARSVGTRVWEMADALGIGGLVRKPLDAVTAPVQDTLVRLEHRGREGLEEGRQATRHAMADTIDAVVAHLADSPQVDALIEAKVRQVLAALKDSEALTTLVRRQVEQALLDLVRSPALAEVVRSQTDQYFDHLLQHPERLRALIRAEGDRYIAYLNAHPDAVQNLVQAQSAGLAGEVIDQVRERTVTADSALELIARRFLGREPREALPAPPPEVQQRAEFHGLPSDWTRTPDDDSSE